MTRWVDFWVADLIHIVSYFKKEKARLSLMSVTIKSLSLAVHKRTDSGMILFEKLRTWHNVEHGNGQFINIIITFAVGNNLYHMVEQNKFSEDMNKRRFL